MLASVRRDPPQLIEETEWFLAPVITETEARVSTVSSVACKSSHEKPESCRSNMRLKITSSVGEFVGAGVVGEFVGASVGAFVGILVGKLVELPSNPTMRTASQLAVDVPSPN